MSGTGGVKRKGNMLDSGSDAGSGSGSDLEQEMLLLSKKKKAAIPPVQNKPKEMSGSSSGSDSDWGLKTTKVSKPKKKKTKTSFRSISDSEGEKSEEENFHNSKPSEPIKKSASDLEEGEVSSSDSEDSSDGEFDDGYDENLMGDDEDKRRLGEMTEKEREQEIFKRVENREIKKTRYEIEKKLKQARKKELKKQRKADGVMSSKFKMDAKERSKERKKTVEGRTDKKSQAMDLLKAKREARKEREEEKEKARLEEEKRRESLITTRDDEDEISTTITERSTKKKLKASDIYSDDSGSDGEAGSTVKVKRERDGSSSSSDSDSESEQKKPVYVTELKDLSRLRLSRQRIEKWIHYPFFDSLAKGMFVRLGIGHNPREQKSVYRIAEILDVVETPKVYTLGQTRTNKGFRLRHGLDERVFRLEFISSQEFTTEEFIKWLEACRKNNISPPTLHDVERKEAELREASNYQFKDADVEHMIQEKQRFKQSPVNYAVRKTQLMKEKETAQQRGDDMRVEEITREISELDERAKELDKARSQSIQSISYINERNRKKNVEQAEKAIMEEIKASKGKRFEDPFTRRNTKPMPMFVNRLGLPGGPTPGTSPRTPDISNTSSIKLEIDDGPEFNAEDIKNEDLLRRIDDDEDNENENVENGMDSLKSEATPVIEEPPTPAALEEKAAMKLIPLDALDITASIKVDDDDLLDGKPKRILTTNDLFSAHDFDINLELDAKLPPNLPIVARPSIPQIREPAPKRSLNLDDYKRKRGLI